MLGRVWSLAGGAAVLGGSALALGCGQYATNPATHGAAGAGGEKSGGAPSPGAAPAGAGGRGATGGAAPAASPGVDPETTRAYTWEECGRIPSSSSDGGAQYAADGTLALALGGEKLVLRSPDGERSIVAELPFASRVFAISNDATLLAEPVDGGVRLRSLPDGAVLDTLSGPAEGCPTDAVRFSPSADRVMTQGETGLCAWRVTDGTLLARLLEPAPSAAFDGDVIVVAYPSKDGMAPVVARFDLSGAELARFPLAASSGGALPIVSPDGKTVATPLVELATRVAALHGTDDGELIWSHSVDECAGNAVFSPGGDLVMMGCTFRVSDGSVVFEQPRHWNQWHSWLALSPTGDEATGMSGHHLAAMAQDHPMPRSFSGHLRDDSDSPAHPMRSLAITPDGTRLVSLASEGLSWDLAPRFEDSTPHGGLLVPYLSRVELSPDGRWASFAGDGRVVQSLEGEGTVDFDSTPVSLECIWLQLQFSPDGQWLVGSSYEHAVNSYRVADFSTALGSTLEPVWSSPSSGCPTIGSLPSSYPSPVHADGDASQWPKFEETAPMLNSGGRHPYDDLVYSPDGRDSVRTSNCIGEGSKAQCSARLSSTRWNESNLPGALAPFPSFDLTGHWIAAGSTLVHLPSGDSRELNSDAAVALFAPNGDIFVGENDSSLVRYCRTPAAP